MIGFYLTLTKDGIASTEPKVTTYDDLVRTGAPPEPGLYILDDDRAQVVRSTGRALFNVGTLIFGKEWKEGALESIARELDRGRTIEELAAETRGQFCLVVAAPGSVCVVTDGLGVLPIYRTDHSGTTQISNIFPLLARNNKVTVDRQAIAEYLSFRFPFNATLFNEIGKLKGGVVYRFGDETGEHSYAGDFAALRSNRYTDLRDIAHRVEEILLHNLSFLGADDRIFADVTGGFDTRTNAVILHSLGLSFDGGHCGEQVRHESSAAAQVTRTLGIEFHSGIKIRDLEKYRRTLDHHLKIFAGTPTPFHSTELVNYYKTIGDSFDIHVAGFGGTQQLVQDMKKLKPFSRKLDPRALSLKYFRLYDFFRDTFITRGAYYDGIVSKIDALLRPLGAYDFDKAANYFRLLTFSRHYHGGLFGAHNTICPLYSPYEERNLLRLTMESSYSVKEFHNIQRSILTRLNPEVSRIKTSHGYTASTEPGNGLSALKKLKTRGRDSLRTMIYPVKPLFSAMHAVRRLRHRVRPEVMIGEVQKDFWVDEVNRNWSDDLPILEILDRKKLAAHMAAKPHTPRLKAQLIYLDRLIAACGATI